MAPSPPLNIPSGATAQVCIIDTTSSIGNLPLNYLMGPGIDGVTNSPTMPSLSFLVESASGKKVLFDLGVRKDWENHAPVVRERLRTNGWDICVEKNVIEILEENEMKGGDIDAIVWSHWHWDHLVCKTRLIDRFKCPLIAHQGDPSTFPPTTDLVVGPGFKKAFLPGAPANNESPIRESDYEGRNLIEVDFSGPETLTIGQFKAVDYFKDGSFYLLDTPGHAIGHLCALVRTTTKPDTFILMGGDACHHGGEFRPSQYLPLPKDIVPNPMMGALSGPRSFCPGAALEKLQRERGRDPQEAFFVPTMGFDIPEAIRTIGKVQEFDVDEDVFYIIAHDDTVKGVVDLFPKEANAWKEKGWAKQVKWAFLKDFEPALKGKI